MFNFPFAAEEMAAIPGAGFLKTLLFWGLVICGALWFLAPTVWEKLKSAMVNAVEAKLNVSLPFMHTAQSPFPATTVAQPYGAYSQQSAVAAQSAGQVTQQRAAELRAVCPKAPAAARLKWLESGTDPVKAQAEYVSMLEDELAAVRALASAPSSIPTT